MPNWNEVLSEVNRQVQLGNQRANGSFDSVRRKYLKKLQRQTGRNVVAYYSGFLSKPAMLGIEINDEDKNGFMMAIHQMDRSKGLDLFLHTPGGSIAAAESLVDYLKRMFGNNIRAIIPQIAMSAGTMIACSCSSIVLSKHSNIGPIDPQINGVPAQGVLDEIQTAYREIAADPAKLSIWQFILGKYTPTYIGQCQQAVDWSKAFVKSQLMANMLSGEPNADRLAQFIVDTLSNYAQNKAHNRHLHIDDCVTMGLKVEKLEDDSTLQDLVLTVHHCFMHTLANTPVIKIIENDRGIAYMKTLLPMTMPSP
jgi:ATP-dependent protease ClpP protease subunit